MLQGHLLVGLLNVVLLAVRSYDLRPLLVAMLFVSSLSCSILLLLTSSVGYAYTATAKYHNGRPGRRALHAPVQDDHGFAYGHI